MIQAHTLSPVTQSSLADHITQQLRSAIISGQLAPGERLAEPVLAERLGVSRSPVREALKRLEAMGLVRSRLNHGAFVWEPTEADVEEIVSLRRMLEIHAAEQVLPTVQADDIEQLAQMIHEQERAIEVDAYLELVESDRNFHEYMIRKTGNARLMGWWEQIMSQWEVLVMRRWRFDTEKVIPRVLRDHRWLLDAIQQRDLNRLLALHRAINDEVCEETKRMLRQQAMLSIQKLR